MSSFRATADTSTKSSSASTKPPSFPKLIEAISQAVTPNVTNPELVSSYLQGEEFKTIPDAVTLEAWTQEYDTQLKAHAIRNVEDNKAKVSTNSISSTLPNIKYTTYYIISFFLLFL